MWGLPIFGAIAQPVFGFPSRAFFAGNEAWAKEDVARVGFNSIGLLNASSADSSTLSPVKTRLPLSARPGPFFGKDLSGRSSRRRPEKEPASRRPPSV